MLTGLTTCPVEGLFFHDAWGWASDGGSGYTWDNANPYARDVFEPTVGSTTSLSVIPRPVARATSWIAVLRATTQ